MALLLALVELSEQRHTKDVWISVFSKVAVSISPRSALISNMAHQFTHLSSAGGTGDLLY